MTIRRFAMELGKTVQRRILIVEDDQTVRQTVKLLLSVDEHTVFEAEDATGALETLNQHRFDLVITDFDMPGMKGDELALRIKRQSPSQPILMMTACAERLCDLDNGADALLTKPFAFEDLRRAITALLSDTRCPAVSGVKPSLKNKGA
jgi:DNA-binding response OmpR family regulator